MKCPHCGAIDAADSGNCGVCGGDLATQEYKNPVVPKPNPLAKRLGAYAGLLGVGELIAVTFGSYLSRSQGVAFQIGLLETAAGLLFLGAFGFLFGGSSGMRVPRAQPWNPYYASDVSRSIREDQPGRMRASLVLLALGALTLAIALFP